MSPLSLRVSANKLNAFLKFMPENGEEDFAVPQVLEHLQAAGIKYGINEASLQQMLEQRLWNKEILVACGQEPARGTDGQVEYFFDPHPKLAPKLNPDGSVDYRNLNLTQNVVAGQQLARLIPPGKGAEGMDIFGNVLAAPSGKAARLLKGKNTNYADDEKTILKADVDGNVKLDRSGFVEVEAAFKIQSNVDFNTGNIDVKGDLVIAGDIKAGFKVKASGNVEVGGTVEDAVVESEGTILVKGGFVGDGKGLVKADSDVILKFVHGQKVIAGGNIHIHEESIQGDLCASGSIYAHDGKGIVIGGVLQAAKCAEVRIAGNIHYAKTEIIVAEKSGMRERLAQLTRDLAGLDAKLNEITEKMTVLMAKSSKIKLSPSDENAFRVLDKLSADICTTRDSMASELKDIETRLQELRKVSYIKILKKIYPGAVLKIAGIIREVNEELGPSQFRVVNGQIASFPL